MKECIVAQFFWLTVYVCYRYLHIRCISKDTGQVRMWKSGAKKGRKYVFPQCKTSIGRNFASIKHRAMRLACSMRFSDMADRTERPPSLSRDRKWRRVTKCTHSRLVGNLFDIITGYMPLHGRVQSAICVTECDAWTPLTVRCRPSAGGGDRWRTGRCRRIQKTDGAATHRRSTTDSILRCS